MDANVLSQCIAYINSQVKPAAGSVKNFLRQPVKPTVTISRQAGVAGHRIAQSLVAFLQPHAAKDSPPWTIFDRDLIEKVLEDHHLPMRLAEFMTEDRKSAIEDLMESALGLHPATGTMVRQTAETILRLAELGHVILLGRGATVITAKLPHVFHVRLVGSLDRRVEHMQQTEQLSSNEALAKIKKLDNGRQQYLKTHYNKDIEDCLLYDLVINTDRITVPQAAHIIGDAVLTRFGSEICS